MVNELFKKLDTKTKKGKQKIKTGSKATKAKKKQYKEEDDEEDLDQEEVD